MTEVVPTIGNTGEVYRLVGFWRGTSGRPCDFLGYPHPSALVTREWNRSERRRVIEYLRSGNVLAKYMGWSYCRFEGCSHTMLGTCDLTDGVWVWPEGLWHYVEHHRIRLPAEFIEDMAARAFVVPPHVADVPNVRTSPAFWLEWAARNTPSPSAEPGGCSLTEAQSICAALSTQHWRAEIAEHLGRWRIDLRQERDSADAERWIDYTGPITADSLQGYLFKSRRPDPEAVLSYERAVAIADEYASGRCLVRPLAFQATPQGEIYWAVIASANDGPTVAFEALDLKSLKIPEPGWTEFLPQGWRVEVMRGMDEPAWRFFLQAWQAESQNSHGDAGGGAERNEQGNSLWRRMWNTVGRVAHRDD